jgi:23S rRNA (guanine745-N1)-methyltransferase
MDPRTTPARPPDRVLAALRCPPCGQGLRYSGGCARCPAGHNFDIARQGYLNLLAGRVGGADTPAMVADRADFLAAGHYAPLAALLAQRVAAVAPGGLVIDAGAGTGYYLGAVLDAVGAMNIVDAVGLALDASPAAARRLARDPRIGAVVWDVWRPWPVRDGVAAAVVNVFAPRNGAEFHRVLRPGGALFVVTPGPDHLAELGRDAGMLAVDPDKDRRLAATLADQFAPIERRELTFGLSLSAEDARRVIGMGPAAFHDRPRAEIDDAVAVTASFRVTAYRPE